MQGLQGYTVENVQAQHLIPSKNRHMTLRNKCTHFSIFKFCHSLSNHSASPVLFPAEQPGHIFTMKAQLVYFYVEEPSVSSVQFPLWCYNNIWTRGNLGGGKDLFGLYFQVIVYHRGKSGQKLKQELANEPESCFWTVLYHKTEANCIRWLSVTEMKTRVVAELMIPSVVCIVLS